MRLQRFVNGDGHARALLTATGGATLTLELLDTTGKRLAFVSGKTPLRFERTLAAGEYTLHISSRKATRYRLQLDYVRPR